MASAGLAKQLGTPKLDPLVVLLREATQNSWDARSAEAGGVSVEYALDTLDDARAAALASVLLPAPPSTELHADRIAAGRHTLRVSDRGTSGLGGPLRSDEPIDGRSADFVNFLRNVGEPRDREYGGGTYGFGKGILFRVSAVSTIIVDTVCVEAGTAQRRIMGAALGASYVDGNRRHTGRHWLGARLDGVIDPLLDAEAEQFATRVGLRGFRAGETGTDVYIIDPNLGVEGEETRSARRACEVLASAAAWYLWPKLIDRSGATPLRVTVTLDGSEISVPDPAKSRRLRPFVRALGTLDAGGGKRLERKTPPRVIGAISIANEPWIESDETVLAAAQPFDGPAHHCARMRHVELVVDYQEGPSPSLPDSQYGAVFKGSTDADPHLADAEPPTHDAWVSEHLTGTSHWVVTRVRRFVQDELAASFRPVDATPAGGTVPLGRMSTALASILPGVAGDGGALALFDRGSGGGGGSGASAVAAVGAPFLEEGEHGLTVAQHVRLRPSAGPVTAVATGSVAADSARERVPPAGSSSPIVIGWRSARGEWHSGDTLNVEATEEREWTVVLRPVPDTATIVSVKEAH